MKSLRHPVPDQFRNPLWMPSGHLQTIFGAYWPCSVPKVLSTFHKVDVPEGDQVGLWISEQASGPNPSDTNAPVPTIVLMIHGLGGNAESPYIRRLAKCVDSLGWIAARMEMRGVGEAGKETKALYHTGRSEDVLAVVQWLKNRFPGHQIALVGFSLGAAVSLHLLTRHPEASASLLSAAAIVSPPLELVACTKGIQKGLNRIYDRLFAKSLWQTLLNRKRVWERASDILPKSQPKTLWDFDDQVTAPLGGFDSALDYYQRCSSQDWVNQIQIPTLILAASDDPIIPVSQFQSANWSPCCELKLAKGGGHLGFLGGVPNGGIRWMERKLTAFLVNQLTNISAKTAKQ